MPARVRNNRVYVMRLADTYDTSAKPRNDGGWLTELARELPQGVLPDLRREPLRPPRPLRKHRQHYRR